MWNLLTKYDIFITKYNIQKSGNLTYQLSEGLTTYQICNFLSSYLLARGATGARIRAAAPVVAAGLETPRCGCICHCCFLL